MIRLSPRLAAIVCGAALLAGCAVAPQREAEGPHIFIPGVTPAAAQNALVGQQMAAGWLVRQQSQNVLVLEHRWDRMNFAQIMFNALNGARESVERDTYEFAAYNGGTEVTAEAVIVSKLGFGNTQTTPLRAVDDQLQATLNNLQGSFVKAPQ